MKYLRWITFNNLGTRFLFDEPAMLDSKANVNRKKYLKDLQRRASTYFSVNGLKDLSVNWPFMYISIPSMPYQDEFNDR